MRIPVVMVVAFPSAFAMPIGDFGYNSSNTIMAGLVFVAVVAAFVVTVFMCIHGTKCPCCKKNAEEAANSQMAIPKVPDATPKPKDKEEDSSVIHGNPDPTMQLQECHSAPSSDKKSRQDVPSLPEGKEVVDDLNTGADDGRREIMVGEWSKIETDSDDADVVTVIAQTQCDLYKNAYLCIGTPVESEYAAIWNNVWDKEIGTVVCLRGATPDCFPPEPKKRVQFDGIAVERLSYDKLSDVSGWSYRIRKEDGGINSQSRLITVFWGFRWSVRERTFDTKVIETVRQEQLDQASRWMPSVMVIGSGAFVFMATLIGFQTWKQFAKIDPSAIFKHIGAVPTNSEKRCVGEMWKQLCPFGKVLVDKETKVTAESDDVKRKNAS